MDRNVAKAGAVKGGSCRGFSGPGERCHPAVSKRHRRPFDDRRGQEKGKGWELQGGFSVLGERCHPALSKRHANTIWQQTLPGKGKVWKLERLRRQAWPGMWQKQVRQRWKLQATDVVANRRGQATANVAHLR